MKELLFLRSAPLSTYDKLHSALDSFFAKNLMPQSAMKWGVVISFFLVLITACDQSRQSSEVEGQVIKLNGVLIYDDLTENSTYKSFWFVEQSEFERKFQVGSDSKFRARYVSLGDAYQLLYEQRKGAKKFIRTNVSSNFPNAPYHFWLLPAIVELKVAGVVQPEMPDVRDIFASSELLIDVEPINRNYYYCRSIKSGVR